MAENRLLAELLRRTPQQPAVAYWRAIELRHLLDVLGDTGGISGQGLDLGCGDGEVMESFARRVRSIRVVGVDIDPAEAYRAARRGVYERVHVGSGSSVPEPSETFQWVLANSVLEHIPDIGPVLAESARLLQAGGLLWITVPSPDFHMVLAGPGLLSPLLGRGAKYFRRLDQRLQHVRYWSPEQWREALLEHGLEVTHQSGYMSAREARRWEFVSSVTGGIVWSVAGGIRTNLSIQRRLGISTGSRWNRLLVLPARMLLLLSHLRTIGLGASAAGRHAGLLLVARKIPA